MNVIGRGIVLVGRIWFYYGSVRDHEFFMGFSGGEWVF
jgi:hypothetical protein